MYTYRLHIQTLHSLRRLVACFIHTDFTFSETSGRMFHSWQAWDLLRLTCVLWIYRILRRLLNEAPSIHYLPDSFEWKCCGEPTKVRGNLMSTNYSSASAIKNDISKRCRDDDYRNAPLFLRQHSHHTDIQKLNKSLLL